MVASVKDCLDFERFAKAYWKVQAREQSKPIPFTLNAPQLIIEYEWKKLKQAGKRVLMKFLKMRQGGISTYCTARVQHHCGTGHGRAAFSIADKLSLPAHWLDRAKRWHDQIPIHFRPTLSKSNANEMLYKDLESTYLIGSQKGQTVGMGFTPQALHLSELSDWSNPKKITDDLYPGVPKDNPDSFIVLESTGWMVGTWWYEQCMLSLDGGDDFLLVFLPWFIMPNYSKPPIGVVIDFDESDYTDEENEACHLARLWMIEHPDHAYLAGFKGLTLGHMAWRRWTIRNEFSGDLQRFQCKYPATPEEAFLSSGSLAIPLEIILYHQSTVQQPLRFVKFSRVDGEVVADTCPANDRLAWTIYEEPTEFCEYAVGGDPAEGILSDKGDERSDRDRSCGAVMDRRHLNFVAEFRTQQIASDMFGEQLLMCAEYYNMAYLGAEFNNNGQATIGPCKQYPNMLMRTGELDDIHHRDIRKLWWKNTLSSRKEMINTWIKGCRKTSSEWRDSIQVHSELLVREEKTFITKPGGKDEHRDGCFDDLLFAHMITYWTHLNTPHIRRSSAPSIKIKQLGGRYAGGVDNYPR